MADVIITIPDDIAGAIETLIDNNIEFIKPSLLRQVLYVVASKIPGPSSGGFTASPPLSYNPFTNNFIISQAGPSNDGYLSKEDYNSFATGGSHNFVGIGQTLVFKNPINNNPANAYVLEYLDIGQRFLNIGGNNVKIEGIYLGGNPELPESWSIQTEVEP
jgi:hypothetical protein